VFDALNRRAGDANAPSDRLHLSDVRNVTRGFERFAHERVRGVRIGRCRRGRRLRGHDRLAGLVLAPVDAAGLELAVIDALHHALRAALDARPQAALFLQDELDLPRRSGTHPREG